MTNDGSRSWKRSAGSRKQVKTRLPSGWKNWLRSQSANIKGNRQRHIITEMCRREMTGNE